MCRPTHTAGHTFPPSTILKIGAAIAPLHRAVSRAGYTHIRRPGVSYGYVAWRCSAEPVRRGFGSRALHQRRRRRAAGLEIDPPVDSDPLANAVQIARFARSASAVGMRGCPKRWHGNSNHSRCGARVSHEGVGRLGQACVYSISGETQSRHCWWLMLAISLAHSMSGGATAGHSRTVASLLAEARWCPVGAERHTDHRAGVAWLGHPLHPLLTDLPIGAWSMAALLDALDARSADVLVGAGIAAAVPTAATGLNDWSDTYGQTTRLGLVHAATNHRAGPAGGVAGGSQPRPPRAGQSVEPGDAQPCLSEVTSADTSPSSRPSTSTTPPGPRDQTRGHKCAPWRIRPTARPGRSTLRGADPAYRRGDAVQAIDATCTHMGGPLADGKFATTA